jgi:DNA-binding transcriptional MerR regulator
MAKPDEADMPDGPEWSLLTLLRESGEALEAVSPPFDTAEAAARLRAAARVYGLLQPGAASDADLRVSDAELEEEAPPFDIEAGAALLREAAGARGLLSSETPEDSVRRAAQKVADYVEVAFVDACILVRNSSDPTGPMLSFTHSEWRAFLTGVQNREFDLGTGEVSPFTGESTHEPVAWHSTRAVPAASVSDPGASTEGVAPRTSRLAPSEDAEALGYRGPTACAAAGITYHQLDYWARTGLVEPSVQAAHGPGSQRLYGFRDILILKVIKRLLDTGISLQQIRAAVQHLRHHDTEDLAEITLMSDGVSVYECTSPHDVVALLQGGNGVFGIALGRVWQELAGELDELPQVHARDDLGASEGDHPGKSERVSRAIA